MNQQIQQEDTAGSCLNGHDALPGDLGAFSPQPPW
jgi:hypothetical protein